MTEKDKLTEEKIFDSAVEVFLNKGMDGTRMQDIADHAGIHKSLLHYYYRSKERLFEAVFEMISGILFSRIASIFERHLSLEDKIRLFFREHIRFLKENPRLPLFILNELNRNPARIQMVLNRLDMEVLWKTLLEQHSHELERYRITKEDLPQLLTTLVSLSVFPFAARALVSAILGKVGSNFGDYIERRPDYVSDFVIHALRKTP